MNKKGFTMVELLAVITIIGVLSGVGVTAYSRYVSKTRNDAYDILAESAITAAEEYLMDHPTATDINFDTLVNNSYLESDMDPSNRGHSCTGTVRVATDTVTENGKLKENSYIVDMCCASGNYQYDSNGRKVETTMCQADFNEEAYIESNSTNCSTGNTKSKELNIYTMEYLNKICTKKSDGHYGACYDPNNPNGNTNYPCRRYQYYQYKCRCSYSKSTSKYCGYEIVNNSSHIMKIKYLETPEGYNACNSDNPGDFNSYVHDVCWDGIYKNGKVVMTFHGYQFFKGQSVGYTDFRPEGTWFHDNVSGISLEDRVQRKNNNIDASGKVVPNPDQGCRDTCVRFTNAISNLAS